MNSFTAEVQAGHMRGREEERDMQQMGIKTKDAVMECMLWTRPSQ